MFTSCRLCISKFLRRLFPNRDVLAMKNSWLLQATPFSKIFGLDRGRPIDRWYFDSFLSTNKHLIKGKVLEIGDDQYTVKFGSKISYSVVLNGQGKKSSESYFGDLTQPSSLKELNTFDCILATNVLNFIYDYDSGIRGLSMLTKRQGGVCLCTVAGLSQISRYDYERWGDYWRFTDMSIRIAFEKYFKHVEVKSYGNAPLASAFIMGLSQEEVPASLFKINDPNYQILISIKAENPL